MVNLSNGVMSCCALEPNRLKMLMGKVRQLWTCVTMVICFKTEHIATINSLRHSDVYVRQQTRPSLVQIMDLTPVRDQGIVCTNAGLSPISLLGTFSGICIKMLSDKNATPFIPESAFENTVCKMAVILSRPQPVNQGCQLSVFILGHPICLGFL